MKDVLHIITAICLLGLASCTVDTYEEIKMLPPTVSLVQTGAGQVALKLDGLTINKTNMVVQKTMGVAYAGYDANEAFAVDLQLDLTEAPDGYVPFAAGECYITSEADGKTPANRVEVPAGARTRAFYFNVTKAAIEANPGKKLAAKIKMINKSRYQTNVKADSVYLLMDMNDFGNLKIDVTATYLKNTSFARASGTTDRFAALADWQSNAAVMNSRPQGAGYDENVRKFGIERWSGGDASIINGKIYQTFQLPKGNYQVEVAMATVLADRDTYFAIAKGNTLPDDTQIGTAIASKLITNELNNKTLTLPFNNPADQQVSAGFLLNFDQGTQKVLQASAVKMFRIETLFD